MKKILFLAAVVLTVAACGASKKAAQSQYEFQEVNVPLSEAQYKSDASCWRAVQNGKSTDLSIAKKIAVQNARTELASTVQGTIRAVIENYARNTINGDANEAMSQFNELSRTVVSQKLAGSGVVAEKVLKDGNQYLYFVCVEMSKDAMKEELANQLAQKKILDVDFNRAQFEKVYNEEMAKFEASR